MKRFHLSFDIAEGSNIKTLDVVRFLCEDLLCKIVFHRVKSTFIFDSDDVLSKLAMKIEQRFPDDFYYELSEVKGECYGKQNPEIKDDYCEVCDGYRIHSKINK